MPQRRAPRHEVRPRETDARHHHTGDGRPYGDRKPHCDTTKGRRRGQQLGRQQAGLNRAPGRPHDGRARGVHRGKRVVGPSRTHTEKRDAREGADAEPGHDCGHECNGTPVEAVSERATEKPGEDHRAECPQRHERYRERGVRQFIDMQSDRDDGELRADLRDRGAHPEPRKDGAVFQRSGVNQQAAKPAFASALLGTLILIVAILDARKMLITHSRNPIRLRGAGRRHGTSVT